MKCVKVNLDDVDPIPGRPGNFKILISPKVCATKSGVMGFSSLEPGEVVTNHVHDYSDEVFYVEQGSGYLQLEGEKVYFKEKDAVYIPKGTEHKVINSGDDELKVVFWVSPLAPSPGVGHREIKEKEEING